MDGPFDCIVWDKIYCTYLHLATFTYLSNSNIEAGKSSPWSALDIILDAEEFWLRPVFVL